MKREDELDVDYEKSGLINVNEFSIEQIQDDEVIGFLALSNLDQVLSSLVHQIIEAGHLPAAHDASRIQNKYPDLIYHLRTILYAYFQEPDGKTSLNQYLSHFTIGQLHIVITALIDIYKPLSSNKPRLQQSENQLIARFEESLIERAHTDFRGIHLPSLRKIM